MDRRTLVTDERGSEAFEDEAEAYRRAGDGSILANETSASSSFSGHVT